MAAELREMHTRVAKLRKDTVDHESVVEFVDAMEDVAARHDRDLHELLEVLDASGFPRFERDDDGREIANENELIGDEFADDLEAVLSAEAAAAELDAEDLAALEAEAEARASAARAAAAANEFSLPVAPCMDALRALSTRAR